MDNFGRYNQTLQAAGTPAPIGNPLGASPEMTNYLAHSTSRGFGGQNIARNATGAAAQSSANARQTAIDTLKSKMQGIQDSRDPSKFQKVKKEDGGFDFYDGAGNRISLKDYWLATGKSPETVLKDSDNGLDRQYLADYENMNKLSKAIQNGDGKTVDMFYKQFPGFKGKTPDQLFNEFQGYYPNVYGNKNDVYGGSRGQVGHSYIPQTPDFNTQNYAGLE